MVSTVTKMFEKHMYHKTLQLSTVTVPKMKKKKLRLIKYMYYAVLQRRFTVLVVVSLYILW